MRSATALFASCALLFSTPATSQLPPIPANCKKGEKPCDVTIIVPAGCGGGIHVAPDPIVVENKDVKIAWTIRSSGTWIFTEKGIVIHTGADKAFSAPSKESDTSFVATRIPAKPGIYKYDITLKRGTEVCKHDPTVVNQ